jgi:hypothetical protein
MNSQQLIAMLLVATAAAYLLRNLVVSARAFFANKSGGCGGCGKCAFAQKGDAFKKPITPAGQPNLIALSDIRTLPSKRKNN